jgi:hypothetical protein
MDPIATARYGMMAAAQRFDAQAARIAGPDGAEPGDFVADMTGLIETKSQFTAQVKVVRISDEMWRALIGLQAEKT